MRVNNKAKGMPVTLVILSILAVVGVMFIWGCTSQKETPQPSKVNPTDPSITADSGLFWVSPQEAFALVEENKNNPDFIIIDDRVTDRYKSGHIANAISVPYGSNFESQLNKLNNTKIYLVYCPTGCGATSTKMSQLGFRLVYEIRGGLNQWEAEGFPVVK